MDFWIRSVRISQRNKIINTVGLIKIFKVTKSLLDDIIVGWLNGMGLCRESERIDCKNKLVCGKEAKKRQIENYSDG